MNYLAHLAVAGARSSSPRYALGAVLSDLCAMSGLRCAFDRLPEDVAAGVRCHWEADRAFHAERTFLAGAGELRTAALAAGLPPGASRAIGHAGWELLLDGSPPVARAGAGLEAALSVSEAASAAFDPGRLDAWAHLVERLRAQRPWTHYDDADFVAGRLFFALRRRPRLAFDQRQVAVVADLLGRLRPSVVAQAAPVLERVVDRIGADRLDQRAGGRGDNSRCL